MRPDIEPLPAKKPTPKCSAVSASNSPAGQVRVSVINPLELEFQRRICCGAIPCSFFPSQFRTVVGLAARHCRPFAECPSAAEGLVARVGSNGRRQTEQPLLQFQSASRTLHCPMAATKSSTFPLALHEKH